MAKVKKPSISITPSEVNLYACRAKDSVKYDAQSLSGGHEFDSGSYMIVKVEKVINLDW